MGPGVTLIDPGKETALAVQDALEALELTSSRTEGGKAEFYVSDTAESFQAAAQDVYKRQLLLQSSHEGLLLTQNLCTGHLVSPRFNIALPHLAAQKLSLIHI